MSDLIVKVKKEKTLQEILKDVNVLETKGSLDKKVEGVEIDSRGVKENYAFFAANGFVQKGSKFIPSAVEKGASVIVIEADEDIEEISKVSQDATIVKVDNVRKALGYMSRNFYDDPSSKMTVIGITGTKGKSTSTFMVKKILEEAGYKTCLIGSIGGFVGSDKISNNTRTTPDSYVIQEILAEAYENYGATHAVIEVSSQAMILERVTGVSFDATAFTNFSEDHISKDEHPTLEDYYKAKIAAVKLAKISILNIDDEEVKKAPKYLEDNTVYTFGIENDADIRVIDSSIVLTEEKIEFDVLDKEKEENKHMELVIPGRFSIYNALTAITIANKVIGINLDTAKEALKNARVLGRLEPVPNKLGLNILLDYAHTASSLENILKAVTSYAKGRVICAWGVGGNRDAAKRPVMGRISGKYADFTILMSDQIRYEDPMQILKDIEVGLKEVTDQYEMYVDRREGIRRAIEIAKKEDTIIIPGFGHDMYQEINGVKHPFDERQVISEIIDKLMEEGMTK